MTYADLEAAQRAVAQLPGSDLLGHRIRAHFALPEPVVPPPPDLAALAARQELIAVRKAQYQRRRARCGRSMNSPTHLVSNGVHFGSNEGAWPHPVAYAG